MTGGGEDVQIDKAGLCGLGGVQGLSVQDSNFNTGTNMIKLLQNRKSTYIYIKNLSFNFARVEGPHPNDFYSKYLLI